MLTRHGRGTRTRLELEPLADRLTPSGVHFYAVGTDMGAVVKVQVYHADGSLARTIEPFGGAFTGGARVAVGDVTGDGTDDVVVAAGPR